MFILNYDICIKLNQFKKVIMNSTRYDGDSCHVNISILRGNVKKKSLFKDIIHIGGWVVKAFSKFFNKLIFDIRLVQIPF